MICAKCEGKEREWEWVQTWFPVERGDESGFSDELGRC